MARWSTFLIFCLVVAGAVADDTTTTTEKPTTTTLKTTTSTSKKTTTEETTTPTTTTPTTTTSTTTTPKTTSPKTDTTSTTSTTSSTTSSTTEKPTTSTTPAPATTTTKPPVFPQNVGSWNITSDNITCLIFKAALEIKFKNESISVPKTAAIKGVCDKENNTEFTFTLEWITDDGIKETLGFDVTEKMEKEGKGGSYGFYNATITVGNETFHTNQTLFETPINSSYKCVSENRIKVEGAELIVSSLQAEAFLERPFDKFSAAHECPSDDVSAVVPVTVGAALIVLVVIVLVAYIIGRKRSRARGYQSV